MTAPSIVSVPEHELVALLFRDLQTFQHIAIPPQTPWPAHVRLRVTPSSVDLDPGSFGDADALLVPHGQPQLAHAVEYKRILMPAHTFTTLQPNKLRELPKGVAQANCLASAGFAFVWFSVLVAVDSRELTRPSGGYLAASGQMMETVYNALPLQNLHSSVGAVVYELTQCFDRPLNESGMLGGHILRMATHNPQPPALTAGIARLIGA
jgi:hypothetical protein